MTHGERSLGQWNAYVEAGRTEAERLARYRQVPPDLQPQVASHMRTVKAIERRAARMPRSPG